MGFFSDHKSSSVGSIPVSPNPIPNPIPEENKSSHLSARVCKLMHMTGSKMYRPVGKKPSPVWGSIYDQRKIRGAPITSEMILTRSTLSKAVADDCRSPNTFALQVRRIEMDHRQAVFNACGIIPLM